MKKWELRRELLLSELKKAGRLSTEEITALLNISESTARRLMIELENDRCLIRCFGGVQAILAPAKEYSYDETKDQNFEQKLRIGSYAAGLVESGDSVFLSGGSTVKYMAMALAERLAAGEVSGISVITNSLVASEALSEQVQVILPGGIFRRGLQVLDGSLTEKNLRSMCFSKAFLGAVALQAADGFLTADIETNSIHEIAITRAERYYVLADSGKFGQRSLISYGKLSEADAIITDTALPMKEDEAVSRAGAVLVKI